MKAGVDTVVVDGDGGNDSALTADSSETSPTTSSAASDAMGSSSERTSVVTAATTSASRSTSGAESPDVEHPAAATDARRTAKVDRKRDTRGAATS